MSNRPVAGDWATDFDHLDARWIDYPYPIWDELRQASPVAQTSRYQGVYLPTRNKELTAVVYVLFPNTVFIVQGDQIETWHVYPSVDGVNESTMRISFYTPEPAATDMAKKYWDKNFDLLMATVEQEDLPIAEGIQRGFHSGSRPAIHFGRNEPALQHYHRSIRQALGMPSV